MLACPACGGGVRPLGVLRHRWWVCARCGTASRVPRQVRAPRPPTFFRAPDPAAAALESAQVAGWLEQHAVAVRGRVLDVGGGPGAALASLAQRPEVEEVLLLEYSTHAREQAEAVGVPARPFDFQRTRLAEAAPGPWDLVMVRYAAAWCQDLPRFAAELRAQAAPGAVVLLTWVLPSRGAFAISQFEREAPERLYTEPYVDACFTAAGWSPLVSFEPAPPMLHPRLSWRWLAGLPVLFRPGPSRGMRQHHAGRIFGLRPA